MNCVRFTFCLFCFVVVVPVGFLSCSSPEVNSVDYNEAFDQIILSSHNFNEIWVIDHSTTTAQAASHSGGNSGMGGDLLYRWGNPRAYRYGPRLSGIGRA